MDILPQNHPKTQRFNTDLGSTSRANLSSPLYDQPNTVGAIRRGKVDRACDACRRRKTKCDGSKMRDNACTTCLHAKKPCTYVEESRPRGPSKAYVTGLEDRMERLEALLEQLRPDQDFSMELGPTVVRGSWKDPDAYIRSTIERRSPVPISSSELNPEESRIFSVALDFNTDSQSLDSNLPADCSSISGTQHLFEDTDGYESSEESTNFDIIEIESISGLVQKLTLHGDENISTEPSPGAHVRFHGKSSSVGLVGATQRFKMMRLLESLENNQGSLRDSPDGIGDPNTGISSRRKEYWTMPQREREWEEVFLDTPNLIHSLLAKFPPPNLALELIHLYFLHANTQFPLLHHATFYRQWEEKLYETNVWFIAVCFGVFALASRWLKTSVPVPEGTAPRPIADQESPGWSYCEVGLGLHATRRRLFYPATLFEIQSFAIFGVYIRGTPYYSLAWTLVGVGIRKAQDVGAHRKKVYRSKPTVDEELWKRAFWCLVVLDRIECVSLGRGCIVSEEDFDVDLPMEVDDEYWESGNSPSNFRQPEGKPAKISAFNQLIRISQVIAFATKTLYATDKSRNLFGQTPSSWRNEIFTRLESTLQGWAASLPRHLSWSKLEEGSAYTIDAATLQITYYLVRILIYQHLIPVPSSSISSKELLTNWSPLSHHAALDICVDAAQACARICDDPHLMRKLLVWPIHIYATELSCAVLLIKVWDAKLKEREICTRRVEDVKPPLVQVVESLMADVKVSVHMLESAEPQWRFITPFLRRLRGCLPDESLASAARLDRYDHQYLRQPFSRFLHYGWQSNITLSLNEAAPKQTLTKQGSNQPSYPHHSDLYTSNEDVLLSPFEQAKLDYPDDDDVETPEHHHLNTTHHSPLSTVSRIIRSRPYLPLQGGSYTANETLQDQSNSRVFSNTNGFRPEDGSGYILSQSAFRDS